MADAGLTGPDLTVVCVLWQGDFRGRNYGPEWVYRLKRMVARNLPVDHRFVCLSNVPRLDVETIQIPDYPPGWWAKLRLFDPALADRLGPRCLYLDLDTLITGDLSFAVDWPLSSGELATAPPSYHWIGGGTPAGGKGIIDRAQSTLMLWRPGEVVDPWAEFTKDVPLNLRGDQDWIGYSQSNHSTFPGDWLVKLKNCQSGPPPGVKIIASMPWKNDVAIKRFEWVRQIWV